jgi:putative tributyrin esterase
MALLTCNFFSEALEMGVTVNLFLPQATKEQIGVTAKVTPGEVPVLYLLHGLSDDHSAWLRYTSIERYAAEAGLAVVMPAVGRSFYANELHGHRYFDFVSEELPGIVGDFFRVSSRREDTFIAGLSMGGYGALKLALTHPTRYAAAASLSGALDVHMLATDLDRSELVARVFGDRIDPGNDLFELLAAADPAEVPPLYLSCGTDEPLLMKANTRLAEAARERGIAVTTDFRPGTHEWGLWDAVIRDVIAWLPLVSQS